MSERMNIYRRDGQAISCINKRLQENVHNERYVPKLSIPVGNTVYASEFVQEIRVVELTGCAIFCGFPL
jgi:hypothetical protein